MARYDFALNYCDKVTEEMINETLKRLNNSDNTLTETILNEMVSDYDAEDGENLLLLYESVDNVGKSIIDATLVLLCGWSLSSIVNIYLGRQ